MPAIAVVIKPRCGEPLCVRQTRVGRHEHPFQMLKFRSMVQEAEALKQSRAARNQAQGLFKTSTTLRVTRLGRWLRAKCPLMLDRARWAPRLSPASRRPRDRVTNDSRGIASDEAAGWHVGGDDAPSGNHGSRADRNTLEDDRAATDPNVILDRDRKTGLSGSCPQTVEVAIHNDHIPGDPAIRANRDGPATVDFRAVSQRCAVTDPKACRNCVAQDAQLDPLPEEHAAPHLDQPVPLEALHMARRAQEGAAAVELPALDHANEQ